MQEVESKELPYPSSDTYKFQLGDQVKFDSRVLVSLGKARRSKRDDLDVLKVKCLKKHHTNRNRAKTIQYVAMANDTEGGGNNYLEVDGPFDFSENGAPWTLPVVMPGQVKRLLLAHGFHWSRLQAVDSASASSARRATR